VDFIANICLFASAVPTNYRVVKIILLFYRCQVNLTHFWLQDEIIACVLHVVHILLNKLLILLSVRVPSINKIYTIGFKSAMLAYDPHWLVFLFLGHLGGYPLQKVISSS